MLGLNSALVAVCSQTNSGSASSPLGLRLARVLEGAWSGLLLGGSVQLSLGIHHGQASRRAKPFLELGAGRGSAPGLVLAAGHGSIAVAATVERFGSCGIVVVSPAAAGSGGGTSPGCILPHCRGLGGNLGSELFPDEI